MKESQLTRSMKHESYRVTMDARQREWALRQAENYKRFRAKVVRECQTESLKSQFALQKQSTD